MAFLRKSIWPITRYNQIKLVVTRLHTILRYISRYNELFHLTEKTVSVFTTSCLVKISSVPANALRNFDN